MAYDFPKFFHGLLEDLKKNDPDFAEELNILINELQFNIYTSQVDWKPILYYHQLALRTLLRLPVIDVNSIKMFLDALDFHPSTIDLLTFAKRFVFIVTKYYYQSDYLFKIFENFLQLKIENKSIEFGNKNFDEIILKSINKKGNHIQSEHVIKDFEAYFARSNKLKTPVHNSILRNLPFDILTDFKSTNKKKIKLEFRRRMAQEILTYLNMTTASITKKEVLLGMSFAFANLAPTQAEFFKSKKAKDSFYEYDFNDYTSYLRAMGKNTSNSL